MYQCVNSIHYSDTACEVDCITRGQADVYTIVQIFLIGDQQNKIKSCIPERVVCNLFETNHSSDKATPLRVT